MLAEETLNLLKVITVDGILNDLLLILLVLVCYSDLLKRQTIYLTLTEHLTDHFVPLNVPLMSLTLNIRRDFTPECIYCLLTSIHSV